MLFSHQFNVTRTAEDDWFDPILFTDTPLFLDPFLLFDGESGEFDGSHDEIIQFFDHVFKLIAKSGGDDKAGDWKKAVSLLALSEVHELCLGFSHGGTRGSGSGSGLATRISQGILAAVEQGVQKLEHFEEVQIFEEGIGADRISDATAGIIRHRIARYTQDVCARHNVPSNMGRQFKSRFDFSKQRWVAEEFKLPINPHTELPIFLVPQKYLRPLPTINPDDFWGYCFATENELVRREFGNDITGHVDKQTIVKLARAHPNLRERYVKSKEVEGGEPYNLRADPEGFYQPYIDGYGWGAKNPFVVNINSNEQLFAAVRSFVAQFKIYVEDNGGWRLLWNDNDTPKREVAFQALLSGIMIAHCRANNIDLSKEPNIEIGRASCRERV